MHFFFAQDAMSDASALPRPSWYRSTFTIALAGSLLLWAALPPLALGWLGWLAPVPWLALVQVDSMPGRRPYRALYLAGLAFWLAAIHWLRLPHPLVYFGWFALSAYLAIYLPLFIGLSRVAVHRLGLPLWLAAPFVWTGLELARAHIMTGFLMASLAHTQVEWPAVIQIADVFGEYGVDFLMVLVAACGASLMRISDFGLRIMSLNSQSRVPVGCRNPQSILLSLLPAALALAATLAYGRLRLSDFATPTDAKHVRIALVQGNSLADWKFDEAKQRQIMDEYVRLSLESVATAGKTGDGRPLDLVVWPETMFRVPLISFDAEYELPPGAVQTKEEVAAAGPGQLARLADMVAAPVLVGIDRLHYTSRKYSVRSTNSKTVPNSEAQRVEPPVAYNSAVMVGRDGKLIGTYDKVHLVMFGEYVPFARRLPFLGRVSTLTGNVEAGAGPVALCAGGVCYSPNICYETVIPHVIRRQVTTLRAQGRPADVLVNLTNDAWYWGSSELAQHLACGVFRAIETRRPLVIAGNGGISAWIDHTGRVRAKSPKQQTDVVIADVELNRAAGETIYMQTSDLFAGLCLAGCVVVAVIGWGMRRRQAEIVGTPS
jgi:apolipoprotein N-acyltransferase